MPDGGHARALDTPTTSAGRRHCACLSALNDTVPYRQQRRSAEGHDQRHLAGDGERWQHGHRDATVDRPARQSGRPGLTSSFVWAHAMMDTPYVDNKLTGTARNMCTG